MRLAKWGRALQLDFWGNIRGFFKEPEEDLPLEDDPVGEFLWMKEKGIDPFGDEDDDLLEAEPDQAEEPVPGLDETDTEIVRLAAEGSEEALDGAEAGSIDGRGLGADEAVPEAELNAQVADEEDAPDRSAPRASDSDVEDVAMAAIAEVDAEYILPEEENEEGSTVSDSGSPAVEPGVTRRQMAAPAGGDGSAADDDVGDLLEVFKTEKLAESPTSLLAKELSDVNLQALLEESRRVAARMRRKR